MSKSSYLGFLSEILPRPLGRSLDQGDCRPREVYYEKIPVDRLIRRSFSAVFFVDNVDLRESYRT